MTAINVPPRIIGLVQQINDLLAGYPVEEGWTALCLVMSIGVVQTYPDSDREMLSCVERIGGEVARNLKRPEFVEAIKRGLCAPMPGTGHA